MMIKKTKVSKGVLLYLLDHHRDDRTKDYARAAVTLSGIAKATGHSKSNVRLWLRTLEDAGLILLQGTTFRKTKYYALSDKGCRFAHLLRGGGD